MFARFMEYVLLRICGSFVEAQMAWNITIKLDTCYHTY